MRAQNPFASGDQNDNLSNWLLSQPPGIFLDQTKAFKYQDIFTNKRRSDNLAFKLAGSGDVDLTSSDGDELSSDDSSSSGRISKITSQPSEKDSILNVSDDSGDQAKQPAQSKPS